MSKYVIHTFNARDNILFEMLDEVYAGKLTDADKFSIIEDELEQLIQLLGSIGVKYTDLKNALIPHADKKELLLVFDTTKITDFSYGNYIFENLLTTMSHHLHSSYSVFFGDYIHYTGETDAEDRKILQEHMYLMLIEGLNLKEQMAYRHSSQFFLVYINNLPEKYYNEFISLSFSGFVGYIDLTYNSMLKNYISRIIVSKFIKHKSIILMSGDFEYDDMPDTGIQEYNTIGYDFEKHGFKIVSVPGSLYSFFLSYKIESILISDDTEILTHISLFKKNLDIKNLNVILEEAKNKYLHREKSGSLSKAGLFNKPLDYIVEQIKKRVELNCIYSLRYEPKSSEYIFTIMLEFADRQSRHVCILAYNSTFGQLRVITFY